MSTKCEFQEISSKLKTFTPNLKYTHKILYFKIILIRILTIMFLFHENWQFQQDISTKLKFVFAAFVDYKWKVECVINILTESITYQETFAEGVLSPGIFLIILN
jgi:hypothetical protein